MDPNTVQAAPSCKAIPLFPPTARKTFNIDDVTSKRGK